jgi:hypothetical protein
MGKIEEGKGGNGEKEKRGKGEKGKRRNGVNGEMVKWERENISPRLLETFTLLFANMVLTIANKVHKTNV